MFATLKNGKKGWNAAVTALVALSFFGTLQTISAGAAISADESSTPERTFNSDSNPTATRKLLQAGPKDKNVKAADKGASPAEVPEDCYAGYNCGICLTEIPTSECAENAPQLRDCTGIDISDLPPACACACAGSRAMEKQFGMMSSGSARRSGPGNLLNTYPSLSPEDIEFIFGRYSYGR